MLNILDTISTTSNDIVPRHKECNDKMRVLSDMEIETLLAERKALPDNWDSRLALRDKARQMHRQREFELRGDNGNDFRIVLRQNLLNQLDFSIILTFVDKDRTEYRLVRFNGRHPSQHTNKFEKRKGLSNFAFRNRFHIHRATERYQMEGLEIDGYAEVTDRYDSFDSALTTFVTSNGIVAPGGRPDEPLLGNTGTSP
jgi:hypothetical protein